MRKRLESRINRLAEAMDQVNWKDKRIYAAYMAQTYYYVRHSTRLLAAAAARLSMDDETAHQRFIKHIAEENHHERLAENDVKALGFQMQEFPELESLKAFYRVQYYFIDRVSSWSLLGDIVALENLAVLRGEVLFKQASELYGAKAATFLKVHAAEDVEHVERAFSMIESLPEQEIRNIAENLEMSCYLYEAMLKDLPVCAYGSVKKLKAA